MKGQLMTKSILITGGAASGKARFAVTEFKAFNNVLYLRVGEELDADITHRIEYGANQYNVEWCVVHKRTEDLAGEVSDHKFAILDSVSAYTRLVMEKMFPTEDELSDDKKKQVEKRVIDGVTAMCDRIAENNGRIIIITLETGFSITSSDKRTAAYRDILGRVNQRVANSCDEAYFSASGIQFKIK